MPAIALLKNSLPKQALWLLLPFVLWAALMQVRPWLMQTRCASSPQSCQAEHINYVDRVSIGLEIPSADELSYYTQNSSGALATVAILGFGAYAAGVATGARLVLVAAEAAGWNGAFNELVHLISQRARPFVYSNPALRGTDPAHYTSFYSGHTSFSAVSLMSMLLILWALEMPLWGLISLAVVSDFLIVATGIGRVLAGRHFITDVFVGMVAGLGIACLTIYWRLFRQRPNQ